jgi:hypothetical protein
MKFSELMNQEYSSRSGIISFTALKESLPDTPDPVLEQWFSDHGRKYEFQEQYQEIQIDKISWNKVSIRAAELIECEYYSRFSRVNDMKARADYVLTHGWQYVDGSPGWGGRAEVINSWENKKTWLTPPIFLNGTLLNLSCKYRLVEGHTRTGLLKGLVENKVISPESTHEIWYGTQSSIE